MKEVVDDSSKRVFQLFILIFRIDSVVGWRIDIFFIEGKGLIIGWKLVELAWIRLFESDFECLYC